MVRAEPTIEGFCEISIDRNNMPAKEDEAINDDFEVIEDAGDQALIAFYNESPSSPSRVPILDKVK